MKRGEGMEEWQMGGWCVFAVGGERRWSGRSSPGRSWENSAGLYGAVTGEDGLAVTCCQSGGGVDGVEVNDGFTWRFLQNVTVPKRGTFTSSSSQNQPCTFYITSTDRCMYSQTLFLLFHWAILEYDAACVIAVSVWSQLSNSREFYTHSESLDNDTWWHCFPRQRPSGATCLRRCVTRRLYFFVCYFFYRFEKEEAIKTSGIIKSIINRCVYCVTV